MAPFAADEPFQPRPGSSRSVVSISVSKIRCNRRRLCSAGPRGGLYRSPLWSGVATELPPWHQERCQVLVDSSAHDGGADSAPIIF